MSEFKEWDVVYDPSDDMLMIYRGVVEVNNAWCEYPYSHAVNTVFTSLDSLVYIGQFWTDKERLMHEKQREIDWRIKEMQQLLFKAAQLKADIELVKQQPLPQFDENGMIKIVSIEKVVKPRGSRYVLWKGNETV